MGIDVRLPTSYSLLFAALFCALLPSPSLAQESILNAPVLLPQILGKRGQGPSDDESSGADPESSAVEIDTDRQKQDLLSPQQLGRWSRYYLERAGGYELRRSDSGVALTMVPEPLTRWTNLVVSPDLTHGECFVWTHQGRPEAFVSLFSYNKEGGRTVAHAWNTFSRHPLKASFEGSIFWTPQGSDEEEMKRVPKSPVPADTRAARLVQMRGIARAFTARSGGTHGNKDLSLRLLATPVYRYTGASDEALDGALFAFVTGTDPEVLLLVEAGERDGQKEWQYQLYRHSHLTLTVKYQAEEVWKSLRGSADRSIPAQSRPYRSQHGVDSQPLVLP